MLKRLVLGLLVLWAGAGLLAEIRAAATTWDNRAQWRQPQWSWRFGASQLARLQRCTEAAASVLPPGSVVAFAGQDEPKGSGFYQALWVGYLMPAHNVLPLEDPASGKSAEYLLTYDVHFENPRLEPFRRLPGCRLYRVKRP